MSMKMTAAYERTNHATPCQREIEARAFAKAVFLLEEAKKAVHDHDAYVSALRFNQVLWTIVQADVAADKHRLPDHLKANILSLSIFVDTQTITALVEPKAEHLESLIAIDKNIAGGLLGNATAEPSSAAGDPAAPPGRIAA